jgi:hypothetical protein
LPDTCCLLHSGYMRSSTCEVVSEIVWQRLAAVPQARFFSAPM